MLLPWASKVLPIPTSQVFVAQQTLGPLASMVLLSLPMLLQVFVVLLIPTSQVFAARQTHRPLLELGTSASMVSLCLRMLRQAFEAQPLQHPSPSAWKVSAVLQMLPRVWKELPCHGPSVSEASCP